MKLIEATQDRWSFRLTPAERAVLVELIETYPCVPSAHARHQAATPLEHARSVQIQQLLDEALAEHRATLRRQIRHWIQSPETLRPEGQAWTLHLRAGELEMLLQVLNDIRVGNWIALGCPDPLPEEMPRDPQRAHAMATMELAGWFEISLLHQIRQDSGS
ncbi:MAG: hypothetical protein RMN51_02520 [Verrucomicrobiota bacterium]|nr:hypothetical protein [Limisphaera sp.]MDW8380971.1 hypothetical protein [Verrucomicrobiota bacterium]